MSSVVPARVKTWGEDTEVNDNDINRWMDDDILLSTQLAGLMKQTHYPHVATSDNTLSYVAAADQVSLVSGQVFIVAGVLFNTADLETLVFAVADDSTKYLRAKLPDGFGQVKDETADPIERTDQPEIYWAEGEETDSEGTGGGPSSKSDMRILKAVKGSAGETPTITAYANDAHSGIDQALPALGGGGGGNTRPPEHSRSGWMFRTGSAGSGWRWSAQARAGDTSWPLDSTATRAEAEPGLSRLGGPTWCLKPPISSPWAWEARPRLPARGTGRPAGPAPLTTRSWPWAVKAGESISTAYGTGVAAPGGAKEDCVGDIREDGGSGCPSGSNYLTDPPGGVSRFGHLIPVVNQPAASNNTQGPGAGGRGASGSNGTSEAGTDGNDGLVRVYYFGPVSAE